MPSVRNNQLLVTSSWAMPHTRGREGDMSLSDNIREEEEGLGVTKGVRWFRLITSPHCPCLAVNLILLLPYSPTAGLHHRFIDLNTLDHAARDGCVANDSTEITSYDTSTD